MYSDVCSDRGAWVRQTRGKEANCSRKRSWDVHASRGEREEKCTMISDHQMFLMLKDGNANQPDLI